MPIAGLLPRQTQNCIACPATPPCSCGENEQCVLVNRDCDTCAYNQCIAINNSSSSSGGHSIGGGAVAGAVIASVVFLAAIVTAFLWYRRRARLARTAIVTDAKPDVPARAEDVLNRPDPNEKAQEEIQEPIMTVPYAGASAATFNVDAEAQNGSLAGTQGHNPVRASAQSDPFQDNHSIQSASTGTQSNVIPIALVGPQESLLSNPSSQTTNGSVPSRPVRSPDLDLNLDHTNVSTDGSRSGTPYSQTNRSYLTPTPGNIRNSYMSTGSFASDLLNEAPVIVTPIRGTVKQVVGVVKAEVIRTPPGSQTPNTEGSGTPRTASSIGSRPPYRSPLASSSFGPSDIMHETDEEHQQDGQGVSVREDPFGDENSPYPGGYGQSPSTSGTQAVFSTATTPTLGGSTEEAQNPQDFANPWAKSKSERPISLNTQAGSVITASIGTAARVQVGLNQLSQARTPIQAQTLHVPSMNDVPATPVSAALSTPRTPYRMTSAKLVASPGTASDMPTGTTSGSLERQLQRAIDDLESSRMSRASVLTTSTRADSILEGFPFVPPSPISDRPMRTPPRSPLAQNAFNGGNNPNNDTSTKDNSTSTPDSPLPAPPNRKMLGMSTGSLSSTVSNGLGSFPFQIDNGNGPENPDGNNGTPPPGVEGRQRASLDTLAITSDLTSYPLGYDPTAMKHYPGPRR